MAARRPLTVTLTSLNAKPTDVELRIARHSMLSRARADGYQALARLRHTTTEPTEDDDSRYEHTFEAVAS